MYYKQNIQKYFKEDHENKKAFTLAEAILTMMILGILAVVMIASLKPSQYKDQAYNALKKKLYTELDSVTQNVLVDCAKDMKATSIYDNCDKTSSTHSFGSGENEIYARYLRGTTAAASTANGSCYKVSNYSSLKLKNGVCLYFGQNEILIDINGIEGPNENCSDQIALYVGENGMTDNMSQVRLWDNVSYELTPPVCNDNGCTMSMQSYGSMMGGWCTIE